MARTNLLAFVVKVDFESRIFLMEPIECTREIGSFLPRRFDSEGNNRLWNEHGGLENNVRSAGFYSHCNSPSLN
jgi:hypothetical protein